MSVAIIDFTTHPYTKGIIATAQQAALEMMDNKEDIIVFVQTTVKTLFNMLQSGYIDFKRDIAEAILSEKAGNDFFIGRHGIRPLVSTWAKEKFPKAKYEVAITLVDKKDTVVHTLLVYL